MSGAAVSRNSFVAHYGALRARNGSGEKTQPAKVEQKAAQGDVSSMSATIVNVTKGIVGSGMLALPLALHDASVIPGTIALFIFAGIAAFSYWLLGYCCAATGARTFAGLWGASVGESSAWTIQASILLDNCFTLWAYSTLVADFLGKAFGALLPGVAFLQSRGIVLGTVGTFFFAPLCFCQTLDALKYTSAVGLAATAYSLLYVCADYGVSDAGVEHLAENLVDVHFVIFKSIALFAFAFLTHYAAPKVYSGLENHTPRRWGQVTGCSFAMAFSIYGLFAVCGYARFGAIVQGNVLKNYGQGSKAVLFMWVAMALSVMFSYPLIFATFKENLYGLSGTEERNVSVTKRLMIVIVGVGCSITLGSVLEDASLVMGICGAVVSSAIEFIFPALIYLHLPASARSKGFGGPGPLQTASRGLICVGIVAMVIGTGATIADALH